MKRPLVIGIGGAHSGIGKTTIAAAILRYLKTSGLAGTRAYHRWGAIKYTRTAFYTSITDDKKILAQKGKDTRKLLDAGAEEVLWVQSPANALKDIMPAAIERLSPLDGIIIEGNSAIEFSSPDIVIFILGVSKEKTKPSAQGIRKQADIIIVPKGQRTLMSGEENTPPYCLPFDPHDEKTIQELAACTEMVIKENNIAKVRDMLREKAIENRISCAVARKIAEESGISYKEVGHIANEMKIKIKNCELGCF
ncbi:MAG: molybdopterin-guanine dinucleotide biosynthesis protein MobB [Nitrospirae bacterium]|nr:molybdopterin-guanine dinucleotide biosynthesis protein MobB [Nitrospirota bacterium]